MSGLPDQLPGADGHHYARAGRRAPVLRRARGAGPASRHDRHGFLRPRRRSGRHLHGSRAAVRGHAADGGGRSPGRLGASPTRAAAASSWWPTTGCSPTGRSGRPPRARSRWASWCRGTTRVVVDELHHGYEGGGSLAGATLDWSLRSPWGWAVWQVAVVGLIGLLGAGIRFGPVRSGDRAPAPLAPRARAGPGDGAGGGAWPRRGGPSHGPGTSAAALGDRTARTRAIWTPGLRGLAPALRTERGREALADITQLTRRQPSADEVLRAANDVETLWQELKPR